MYLLYVICIDPKFVEVTKFSDIWFTLNYRRVQIVTNIVFYVMFLNYLIVTVTTRHSPTFIKSIPFPVLY